MQGPEITTDLYGQLLDVNHPEKTKNVVTGDELAAQTGLILAAGHDTTATTLCFGLLELARAPELQDRLRAEIYSHIGATRPGGIPYDAMPLLNAFIKEVLRVYPAEAFSDRIATQDAVIPLTDSITTSTGKILSEIPVHIGQIMMLGLGSSHRLESCWGVDAHEFRPARWLDGSPYNGKGEAVGPYANLLTFLGGPRTCPGWRFAILEMQIFFCELIQKFSFELPENDPVHPRFATTLIPTMSNGQKGAPLCIKRIVQSC